MREKMADPSEPGTYNETFSSLPTTVFESMSLLAAEHKSINLGQGFPDKELEGPASMKAEVTRSLAEESNQYPPMLGLPQLRQAVARHSERHGGMAVDWTSEVLVTVGATEALAAAFLGLLNAGEEVVLFAPLYDSYVPMIRRAGARPRVINLAPPSWNFTQQDLDDAFSSRTKLVVINTPHNPTGKVWTRQELEMVATAARQVGAYAILDEVYQHLVFPGHTHVSLRSLPGMSDRCLRIGSAGKTFSFTDFKVGWLTGPKNLVRAVAKAHQFLTFTVNSALQRAVAHGLENEEDFYTGLGSVLSRKRAMLQDRLVNIGFKVLPAHGTYFLVADFSPLYANLTGVDVPDDVTFCFDLTRHAGVTLIPVSAFYDDADEAPRTLVRFVFCKTDDKLSQACDRIEKYFGLLKKGPE